MNNAKVLPAQTLQRKHYSLPYIHIPAGVYSFVGVWHEGILCCCLEDLKKASLLMGPYLRVCDCAPNVLFKQWRVTVIPPFISQEQCVINVFGLSLHANGHQ